MTEKNYGGSAPFRKQSKENKPASKEAALLKVNKKEREKIKTQEPETEKEKILKAGKIAAEIRKYAKEIIKKEVPLLEIAEKLETKITELGGKPAFPLNLSINEIAAHYTPLHDDTARAHGLLKVDIGVHIDGLIADSALTIDLENTEENKKLIKAAEEALENAIKILNPEVSLNIIGKTIQETIESYGFSPIVNLSGHSMEKYDLHAGITIPNIDNNQERKIGTGLFAIEPFSTTGGGKVSDGKPSNIYQLVEEKNIRSPLAREILNYIITEYRTVPFCERWLYKKFGARAIIALKQLEENGNLHQFPQLVESTKNKVAQAEHTILIDKETKVTTRD